MSSLWNRIRQRKVVQWTLAYLAGGWVLLQVLDILAQNLGMPAWVFRVTIALLAAGFLVVLVLAWYHGEKGRQRVSGVEVLMLAGILVIAGGVVALVRGGANPGWGGSAGAEGEDRAERLGPSDRGGNRSIAVLPFENLSADPEQRYFSDGVSDQILNALTRIPDLDVTARTSAFAFRDSDLGIRAIADSLGVATVLEGSVHRAGERVRITAQLIEAEGGFDLWSDTYETELTDIFQVQDEVARRIAERLAVELTGVEGTRLADLTTASVEAHDHYLRGRQLLYQRTPGGIEGAVDAFHHSAEADPSYAPAYVGLAEAYALGVPYGAAPPDSSYRWAGRALAYADRAVALDPMSGEAHAARAYASMVQPASLLAPRGPADRIEQDYLKALELQPSSADALGWYAQLLSAQGRHGEALEMQERSIALDPVSPGRRLGYQGSALWAGEYGVALEQLRRARAIQPGLGGLVTALEMWILLLLGRAEECLDLDHALPTHEPMCLHEVDRTGEARARIESLVADWTPTDPWLVADGVLRYYGRTGEVGPALRWLERGLEALSYFPAAYMMPGLWAPLLEEDEERVRSETERIGARAWERILEERRRVVFP